MLTPRQIQGIANDITQIYSGVESDCIRRVVKALTSGRKISQASLWQMKKLNDVGALRKDLLRSISAESKRALPEVEHLVHTALEKSYLADVAKGLGKEVPDFATALKDSKEFQRITSSAVKYCKDIMNLTGTKALQASEKLFRDSVNNAYLSVVTGNSTLEDAVKQAVGQIGESGIRIVERNGNKSVSYASGRTYPLDSAIRRDITTQINQSSASLTLESCSQLGCTLVETSWHNGARPEHELWQGRIFSLDPNDTRYPYFYASQEAGGTGYGDMLGLCGINCYHSFSPYWEGTPRTDQSGKPTAEENEKLYQEQQTQRYYERRLRTLKRQQIAYRAGGYEDEARETQARINKTSADYKQFLVQTGRTRVSMLDSVSGYHRIGTQPPKQKERVMALKTFTPSVVEKIEPKPIWLEPKEYAMVVSELDDNYSKDWEKEQYISKYIGDHCYYVKVSGYNDYQILEKAKIK